jgi:putative protease
VHNSKAREFYEICDCKIEENSFESSKPKNCELMRTKHCLKRASLGCGNPEELFLIDEKELKYPLKFDCKNCEMVILAP